MQALKMSLSMLTQTITQLVQQITDCNVMNVLPSVLNLASEGLIFIKPLECHFEPVSQSCETQHIKPVTPADFAGDHVLGRAFLNLCGLYITLVPHQFMDDHVKVMWALLFMKGGHATHFIDHHMHSYQTIGSLHYLLLLRSSLQSSA
jgi:hypothetical protein